MLTTVYLPDPQTVFASVPGPLAAFTAPLRKRNLNTGVMSRTSPLFVKVRERSLYPLIRFGNEIPFWSAFFMYFLCFFHFFPKFFQNTLFSPVKRGPGHVKGGAGFPL